MDRVAAQSAGNPGAEDWIVDAQALVSARSGRLQVARRPSSVPWLWPRRPRRERAAAFATGTAVWETVGNAPAARRSATAALALSKGRDVEYGSAFAFALSGDFSRSQALADDLAGRFRKILRWFSYLPALRGLFELIAAPLSGPRAAANGRSLRSRGARHQLYGILWRPYPAYVRGLAYLAAHRGVEAAAEFQKILDHRGLVLADPVGAVARLQQGRAFVLAGDKGKAKAAYQDFLTLWKDAAPGIPILGQAKAEFARL